MLTAPVFIAEAESVWNTTATKTVSVTTQAGDQIVVAASNEDNSATAVLAVPSGGGNTYTQQQLTSVASHTQVGIWAAPTATAQTFTLSQAETGGNANNFGTNALVWRATAGIGASSATTGTGTPSLSLTTTRDNSAIVAISSDWAAVSGTSRTWLTVNGYTPTAGNGQELTYNLLASSYTVYIAYWPDVGVRGAKTVGLSAPTGQTYSIAAVEVFGTGTPPVLATPQAVGRSYSW